MAIRETQTDSLDAQKAPQIDVKIIEPAPEQAQPAQPQPPIQPQVQPTITPIQSNTAHATTAQTTATPKPQEQTMSDANAPSLLSLITMVNNVSSLSDKGRKYFDRIKDELSSATNQNNLPVKIYILSSPAETMALECGGKVILMTPSETLSNIPEGMPKTVVLKDAYNTYRATVSGQHELLEFMIIHPNDYDCVEKMITALQNFFLIATRHEFKNMDINMLKGASFVISTNVADVNNFIARVYPHAVSPRCDMGFVLYQRGKNPNQYGASKDYFDQGMQENTPIACVTAFTEPLQIPNTTFNALPKILPLVHISSIVSVIPDLKLTALLLPLATDVFLRSGLWKNQFSQFSKEQPNIGKLFRSAETNLPGFVENPMQRDWILDNQFEKPAMVLDVVEGTYRIPGLEKYGIDASAQELLKTYAEFLGADMAGGILSNFKYHEYVGTITHNSRVADSRWADYLNTIIHYESDWAQVQQLMIRSSDPKVRVDQIRRFYPTYEVLYSNIVCEINLGFMMSIQNLIREHIQIAQNSILGAQNLVDLSSLMANGQQFSQNAGIGFNYGGGTSVFGNPMSVIYRG